MSFFNKTSIDNEIGPPWVKDSIFYQIFPDRFYDGGWEHKPKKLAEWDDTPMYDNFFGGDLKGVGDKLGYLEELGISAIWFNPIFEASTNHKYNTKDYFKIDPHFGDTEVFKDLLRQSHDKGIRIILDGVFNHTGTDFFAFKDIKKKGRKSEYVNWYHIHEFPEDNNGALKYESWWGVTTLPELNTNNPEVRNYLFSIAKYWIGEVGIDGWRLDVPNEIDHDFWIDFRKIVKGLNPKSYIVGEIWDNGSAWLQGDQFDGVMNYLFRDTVINFFARNEIDAEAFDNRLSEIRSYYRPDVNYYLLNMLGTHDTPRFLTVCNGDIGKMSLAVIFQMTYVGVPIVYYGDEVGLEGNDDPDCRKTMIWDESKQNKHLLELHKKLIRIRNTHPAIRRGDISTFFIRPHENIYSYVREYGSDKVIVILNNSNNTYNLELPVGQLGIKDGSKLVDILNDTEYPVIGGEVVMPAVKPYYGGVFVEEAQLSHG